MPEVSRSLGLVSGRCRQDQEECVWKKINTRVPSYEERKPLKEKELGTDGKPLGTMAGCAEVP